MENLISGHSAEFWLGIAKTANRFYHKKHVSVTDCVNVYDSLRTGAAVADVAALHGLDYDSVHFIAVLCGLELNYRQLKPRNYD